MMQMCLPTFHTAARRSNAQLSLAPPVWSECYAPATGNVCICPRLAWASRSRLPPFVKLARTIRQHADGILAYVRTGLSNGLVEGLNGKARVITRRAFGFHSADSLIAMLFLCRGGIHLEPWRRARPEIHPTHALGEQSFPRLGVPILLQLPEQVGRSPEGCQAVKGAAASRRC